VPGVKKTHPCPYCGKNLSRGDAIKRHVVSKQCPVANDKGYGWPRAEGHVPPPPDTHIERKTNRSGENPYPVLAVSPSDRSGGFSSSGHENRGLNSSMTSISSPGGYDSSPARRRPTQVGISAFVSNPWASYRPNHSLILIPHPGSYDIYTLTRKTDTRTLT